MNARERLIVGLDLPTVAQAESIVSALGDDVLFYKIGHQLAFAGGLEFAKELAASGKKIFLDMKLLDIDSSFAARKELATELGCPADLMGDSAKMNMWLHKTVLAKIAANGGNVPKELLD